MHQFLPFCFSLIRRAKWGGGRERERLVYVHAKHAFSQDSFSITSQPCAVLDKGPDPNPLQLISSLPILLSTHLWIGSNHDWGNWYSNLSTLQCLVFVLHWEPSHTRTHWGINVLKCTLGKVIMQTKWQTIKMNNNKVRTSNHWHAQPHQTIWCPISHKHKTGLELCKLN